MSSIGIRRALAAAIRIDLCLLPRSVAVCLWMEDIPLSHLSRPQLVNLLLRIVDLLSQPVQLARHTQTSPPLEPYDASIDPWNAPDIAQPADISGHDPVVAGPDPLDGSV